MRQSDPAAGIGRQMAAGAAWVVGTRSVIRLLGLLSTLILARLLTPADFGLIALATILAAAVEQFGMFGFEIWLIRHPAPERSHYDTIWTLSLIRAAIIATIVALLSAPLARYFDEPRLFAVLLLLAASSLVQGLVNVGVVDFQKHLQFDKDFLMFTLPRLAAFVVTVSCGMIFRSYWALVAGIATNKLGALALSYRLHPFRPRMNLTHWRETFDFSKWMFASSWGSFAYQRADTFLLGKLAGADSLGLYVVAQEIANLVSSELIVPIRRVMLPGYSRLHAQPERLQSLFVDGFALIVLLGLPCAIGVGLIARPLVDVVLGPQWTATVALIQILAWYAVASVGISNQGPMLIVLGLVRTSAIVIALGVALLIPAFAWAAANHGAVGGALAATVVNWVMLAVSLVVTLRCLRMSMWPLIASTWRCLLAASAMYVVVNLTIERAQGQEPLVVLIAAIVSGALSYAITVLGLWIMSGSPQGAEAAVLQTLNNMRRGKQTPTENNESSQG